ncbi:Zinc finger domain containing protein [Aphelenchoides fujianensis]|nr:Zinc finger domain containing protein [Aphelenchoides fujianensis]
MNIATAQLAASLGLKGADLLRALSATNVEPNADRLPPHPLFRRPLERDDSEDLEDMEETLSVSGESVEHADGLPTQRAAKRCKSGSGHEDHSSDDGIEIDSPPHKQLALLDGTPHHNAVDEWMNKTDEAKPNGFRGELKRPDLKGSFRCTICQKVFCHSSSLSRHRMQAHFKSYTCTLCSKEITSNETLRAHMLKQHQISRMFMCRCCNWAFPDKTSLHMHTQGKQDNRTVNVPVIGKGNPPIDSDESNGHRQQAEKDEPAGVDLSTSAPSLNGSLLGNTFGQMFGGGSGMPGGGLNGSPFGGANPMPRGPFNGPLHPLAAAAMAAAAAAGMQLPAQPPQLFPNMGGNPLLNSLPNGNSGVGSNGLFPQLSAMQRGPPTGPLLGANGELNPADQFKPDERFVAEMSENSDERNRGFNSLPAVVQEAANRNDFSRMNGKNALGLQSSGSSPRTTQEDGPKDANLPNLELKAKRSSSAGSPSEQHAQQYGGTIEPISPANTNSSASPSNVSLPCFGFASLKSEGHSQCQDTHEAKNAGECGLPASGDLGQIREHNEYLMQKLLKCRERVINFMRVEQSEAARAEFLRDVLKITFLE